MPALILDGKNISYTIRYSARARRATLRVSDAGLEVVLPVRRCRDQPETLIRQCARWVLRNYRRVEERASRRIAPGVFLLRGAETRARRADGELFDKISWVELAEGAVLVHAPGDGVSAEKILNRWLRSEAEGDIRDRAAERAREMGLVFNRLSLRDQRSLWGSCSRRSGTLSFNWRLVMAPPAVLDYIVVHELAHLKHADHSKKFWALVSAHCAAYRDHRRWLRDNGWRLRQVTALQPSPTVSGAPLL